MKTALPSRRELNLTLQMCPKGRAKNDGNVERVGKELPRPSRRSHGGLKDPWKSPKRPEDPVGPGAHRSALALASWIYKDKNTRISKSCWRTTFASFAPVHPIIMKQHNGLIQHLADLVVAKSRLQSQRLRKEDSCCVGEDNRIMKGLHRNVVTATVPRLTMEVTHRQTSDTVIV